tara:strand:+ start:1508 stop:2017 length:510 start_codon:yes stop_codon:yes gene_type:complete
MNKFIKSWLDYREYLYYYKIILVVIIGFIFEENVNKLLLLKENRINLGYLVRISVEFIGIKYWVFKNNWNENKNLKREIFLFLVLKSYLYLLNPLFEKLNKLYKNISIKGNTKNLINKSIKKLKNYVKYDLKMKDTIAGELLKLLYIFLTTTVIAYPFYRYIIFSPNKK